MAVASDLKACIPANFIADSRHCAVVSCRRTSTFFNRRKPLRTCFLGKNLPPSTAASLTVRSLPPSTLVVRAETDEYEVELDRPYGIKFYKGEDGGTYVDALAAGQAAFRTGVIQEGDKVIATRYVM